MWSFLNLLLSSRANTCKIAFWSSDQRSFSFRIFQISFFLLQIIAVSWKHLVYLSSKVNQYFFACWAQLISCSMAAIWNRTCKLCSCNHKSVSYGFNLKVKITKNKKKTPLERGGHIKKNKGMAEPIIVKWNKTETG